MENIEERGSFLKKMVNDKNRNKALTAPTSDPEFWEEFLFLPEELKETLGGEDFCSFVCDAESAGEMVVFASADAKERLMKSPNWLLGEDLKTFSIFKKVRI